MPIDVDFRALRRAAQRMGATESGFTVGLDRSTIEPIDIQLGEGKEIQLDELDSSEGLLSFEGRQVLLYIPDQGKNIDKVLENGTKGRRFHVADCKTLADMKARGRFERYVVTNDLSGSFNVYGTSLRTGSGREGSADLIVCQNCLEHLNYEGFRSKSRPARWKSSVDFSIGRFFEAYSSFFRHLPKGFAKADGSAAGYSQDWQSISENLRRKAGFQCSECEVVLDRHKSLIHVHHKNGVKSDNRPDNLEVLCKLCHGLRPLHDHIFISHEERKMISECRQQQGVYEPSDWDEVFELADPGLHGILHIAMEGNYHFPEVGLDIQDSSGAVVAYLDLAWTRDKVAVAISAEDRKRAASLGWTVYSPIEGLDEERGIVARR